MNQFSGNPVIVGGLKRDIATLRIWLHLFFLALAAYRDVGKTVKAFRGLQKMKKKFSGSRGIRRLIFAGGRYYWNMHLPGFPSDIFDRHFLATLNRFEPVSRFHNRLAILFAGITDRCMMNCRHCSNWSANGPLPDAPIQVWKDLLDESLRAGVSQIIFTGGEPMLRFDDLVELVKHVAGRSECWLATSGQGVSPLRALTLKRAGLTGLSVSLDHFDKAEHNAFRGYESAYDVAIKATAAAKSAGLMVAWSLCLRSTVCNNAFLSEYWRVASEAEVHFINLLEPQISGRNCSGHYTLNDAEMELVEGFMLQVNGSSGLAGFEKEDQPVMVYDGYFNRRLGCQGAGNRYLYADAQGRLHPCPFCRSADPVSLNSIGFLSAVDLIKKRGCPRVSGHET